jgi:hypothetical protein
MISMNSLLLLPLLSSLLVQVIPLTRNYVTQGDLVLGVGECRRGHDITKGQVG